MEYKKIDFGVVLNHSIEIFKKTFLVAGFAFLILTSTIGLMSMIGIDYFFGLENFAEKMKTFDPSKLQTHAMLLYFGGVILISVLIAPFNAGILKIMRDADQGNEINIMSLFHYINSKYFGSIVFSTLLISLLGLIVNLGLQEIIKPANYGNLVSTLFSVIISILTFLTLPNIIFSDMKPFDAILSSIKSTSRNFISILLLVIIALTIAYLGIIAFCIGIFFTFPIYYSLQYAIFKALSK